MRGTIFFKTLMIQKFKTSQNEIGVYIVGHYYNVYVGRY